MIPSKLGINLRGLQRIRNIKAFVNESRLNQRLFETALKLEGLTSILLHMQRELSLVRNRLLNLFLFKRAIIDVYLTQYSMEHLEEIRLIENGLSWVEKSYH